VHDELPSGTVTFLFTDIEGSTRLLRQLGDRYGDVVGEHRRILREAAARHVGREVDTQGDSCFFTFGRANAALAAAVDAQRGLTAHPWSDGARVRVRMGLHTAEPKVRDDRYVGLGVHRAARIGAAAHGGQVLLSSTTRELVEEKVGGVSIRELGSYRLKDFDQPERLFQVDIEGLQSDFPLLKAEKVSAPSLVRRSRVLLAAAVVVAAAAVAGAILALGGRGSAKALKAAAPDSLGVIDTGSGSLIADPAVGATPTHVAAGAKAYWVSNSAEDSVSKVDPATRAVIDTIVEVGSGPSGITVGNGDVWVANSQDGTVARINPVKDVVVQRIDVGNSPVGIAYGAGSVWVANTADNTIMRIDGDTGQPGKPLPIAATELTFCEHALWVSERGMNQVVRVDPHTGSVVQPITVGNGPTAITCANGSIWVTNGLDGTVSRISPRTNSQSAVIPSGNGPAGLAADSTSIWVSNQYAATLARIDPQRNVVAHVINVGGRPQGLAVSGGRLLVSVATQAGEGHRGGTLTLRMNRDNLDSIDPSFAYSPTSWSILRMTNDGLVGFDQAGGAAGTQLVPNLAVSLPVPTDGGRTYFFQLRNGLRYSNGKAVKASDFRSTLERNFEIGKLPVDFYDGVIGASACKPHHSCNLSRGIVTNDAARTISVHLVSADPDFLYYLALPFAYLLPSDAPRSSATKTDALPGTGPYAIARYKPGRLLELARNTRFREWSKAAQPEGYPDKITVLMGGSSDQTFSDVIGGRADLVVSTWTATPSQRVLSLVTTRYAARVHINPQPSTVGLFLNTQVAPFDELTVRRAVNIAADRAAAPEIIGGTAFAQPTCQILPPHLPGYETYCPYAAGRFIPTKWPAPNLREARALVARSGTKGMKITVWSRAAYSGFGNYAARLLRSLGYRVVVKSFGDTRYWPLVHNSHSHAQIGFAAWGADYPAPSDFFTPILTCASFQPGNASNQNLSGFCDSRIDREVEKAQREQATNPIAARALWAKIDRAVVDQAPWVPLITPRSFDFLSRRAGNYQYSPNGFGVLIDQLWVR
jgi:YVTN family beta-propeller protein